MRKVITLLLLINGFAAIAQNPLIVKSVGSTVLQPNTTTNSDFWKYNEWNGMRFYQGTGTPIKLCVTDGTTAGTKYVTDLSAGSAAISTSLIRTIPAQDFMYLIVGNTINITLGTLEYQLWKSDGTAGGTVLIYSFEQCGATNAPIFGSTVTDMQNYSVIGNTFYFTANTAAFGRELWKTDGTTAGTFMVKDIRTGTTSSNPAWFCKIGNEVFFSAMETYPNAKLWKTDGTAAGTVQIPVAEPFFTGYGEVAIINNKMIFYATDGYSPLNYEPYVTDGTAAGTFKLADINPAGSSYPSYQPEVQFRQNSKYAFFVSTNGTNTSLWRTDGTIAGTIQLSANADNVQSGGSSGSLSDIDENGLWMLNFSSGGSRLFKSDGTVAGTYLAASNLSNAGYLKIYKGAAWFRATRMGASDDSEPWRSGGTAATTNRALDISVGSYFTTMLGSGPFGYFVKNDKLYFFATNNSNYPFGVLPMALYQYTGDFTFNGSQAGGRWRDSTNWNSMMPPGITDTVNINGGTPNTLNVDGANAYAGVLNLQNNATINFTNSTDSLFVNTRLGAGTNNSFAGNGTLALRNVRGDTIPISNGFVANNMLVQSKANLLNGTVSISNNLNLNRGGKLLLNINDVILTGNSSSATGNDTSYIVTNGIGKMNIQNIGAGSRTTAQNYPIGTATNFNPMQFTNAGTADNFGARVQPTISNNYTGEIPAGGSYNSNAVNATWFITEAVAGGSNATINLQWNAGQELAGFNRSISQFGHYNMGAWQLQTATVASGANPYNLTGMGITSFSPFGIFNSAAVLPIKLTNFSAKEDNGSSNLYWATSFELNNKGFNIQQSTDAATFSSIGFVKSKGNSSSTISSYSFKHYNPSSGKNYYRLQQLDLDGKITYSNIEMVDIKKSKSLISIYPNPTSELINIKSNEKISLIELVDVSGRVIKTFLSLQNKIDIRTLTNGMYVLKVWFASGAKVEEKIMVTR